MAAKKKKTKTGKKRNKVRRPGLLYKAVKWSFVAALWAMIIGVIALAWFASELPGIIDKPQFERRNAITVIDSHGQTLARYGELKGMTVHTEELPPHLIQAVLAIEDRRFYDHIGLDFMGMGRAALTNLMRGRIAQGGSTITQQLAKNLFLTPERTYRRKIQEALLALWLEHELTKDEILSAYLNRVYLGAGTYGVDAAARTYFDKPATTISLYEAAMLAGLLRAPSRFSPHSNPDLAAQRTRVVLNAMHDAGYIAETDIQNARLIESSRKTSLSPAPDQNARYYTDWITSRLPDLIGHPANDLTIETSLDGALQKKAEEFLSRALENHKDKNVTQGAIIVMGYDGSILAMVGGRAYNVSQFNRATQAVRPTGSAFKPFVFLTALEKGWQITDMIEDAPIEDGLYRPSNFRDEYEGMVTLEKALARSLNTATVRLMQDVGIRDVMTMARRLGVTAPLDHNLSLALGSSGVPLLEMVKAYAIIANNGYYLELDTVRRITDKDGVLLYQHSVFPPAEPVISPRHVDALKSMLRTAVTDGTGRLAARNDYRAYGKTGTSQDFRDAWFVGFTDEYIAGVWLGNDDNSPMTGITGGSLPAQIWRDVMGEAHKKKGPQPLSRTPSADSSSGGFSAVLRRLLGG